MTSSSRFSPQFRGTVLVLFILILLALFAGQAQAQSAAQGQSSVVSGQSQASIASGAVTVQSYGAPQLPWTSVDQDFHTNQAASAPANIGSTSPGSNTGCPAVDGWSASVVVANGGKTTAKELPGCMLNILGQNIGMLKEVEVLDAATGKMVKRFDGLSVMRLETWCLYDLYKQAIENGMNYKCKATRDAEAAQRQNAVISTTVVNKPGVYSGSDAVVIERLQKQGKL